MSLFCFSIRLLLLIGTLMLWLPQMSAAAENNTFELKQLQWLTMPDGIKLSANYLLPESKYIQKKFPVVLEVLPYRKEDMHAGADYAMGAYLTQHDIAFARVDIRGTGSSFGALPNREYSDQELKDILATIDLLANQPWCNGNVAMLGISWSAFNAMMTATQHPPHLKGIVIAHGSEDLYANDIHNIDGALHIDIFTVEIEVDNILPQSPDYEINEDYFKNRFESLPWIFTYLKQQRDGAFWQDKSLQNNYDAINIPILAYASLLDGYRDYALNMFSHIKSPIHVAIGPQNHSWPNDYPGPQYEWRQQAVDFFQQILNVRDVNFWENAKLMVFMRDYIAPDLNLMKTPGEYWQHEWPMTNTNLLHLYPQANGKLSQQQGTPSKQSLAYKPSAGDGVLNWWGETTPDMRTADQNTLIFDSDVLSEELYLLGNVQVKLNIAIDAPYAHFIARLEDVNEEGVVAFITGGLQNGAQRNSRTSPTAMTPNKFYQLQFPMHFSTWTFKKGHKIRLIITNAQFPMVWATPYRMTSTLRVGDNATKIILPLASKKPSAKLVLPALQKYETDPNIKYLQYEPLTPFAVTHDDRGNTFASAKEFYKFITHGNTISASYKVTYRVNDLNPEDMEFIGDGEDTVLVAKTNKQVKVSAQIRIKSDQKYFHTTVTRKIFGNDGRIRTRRWQESIPRDFQ